MPRMHHAVFTLLEVVNLLLQLEVLIMMTGDADDSAAAGRLVVARSLWSRPATCHHPCLSM